MTTPIASRGAGNAYHLSSVRWRSPVRQLLYLRSSTMTEFKLHIEPSTPNAKPSTHLNQTRQKSSAPNLSSLSSAHPEPRSQNFIQGCIAVQMSTVRSQRTRSSSRDRILGRVWLLKRFPQAVWDADCFLFKEHWYNRITSGDHEKTLTPDYGGSEILVREGQSIPHELSGVDGAS